MVGKLYTTSNSSGEKLQVVSDLVAEAIDGKIATDTATKNALKKYESNLTKVLGEVRIIQSNTEDQAADPTVGGNETQMEVELGVDENEVQSDEKPAGTDAQDTLLDRLLDDVDDVV